MNTCTFDGCDKKQVSKGLCTGHYAQSSKGELKPLRKIRGGTCTFDGCERTHYAKGYCTGHYQQLKKGVLTPLTESKSWWGGTCIFEGCERKHNARGYCTTHYRQWRRGEELRPINQERACSVCGKTIAMRADNELGACREHRTLANRLKRYNITIGDVTDLMIAQDFKCAVCKTEIGLGNGVIDHDHSCCSDSASSCGKCVRAVLCGRCNLAVGAIEDDVTIALRMAAYLMAFNNN